MQEVDYCVCPCCGNKVEYCTPLIAQICEKCLYTIPIEGNPVYCPSCFSPVIFYSSINCCCSNPDCSSFQIYSSVIESSTDIILCWNKKLILNYSPATNDISPYLIKEFPYLHKLFIQVLQRFGYSIERN